MANNYEAIVRAVLDQTQFNADMDKLQNTKYDLRNVKIDTSDFAAEVQKALNSASFNVNVNPVFSNASAKNAAQSLTNGMAAQIKMGSGAVANTLSKSLSTALSKQGIVDPKVSDAIIKSFTSSLDKDVNVNLSSIKATIHDINEQGAKLKKLNISAFDDAGRKINSTAIFGKKGRLDVSTEIIQQFAKVTSAAKSTSQTLSDSIKFKIDTGGITASISKVESQFDRLKSMSFDGMGDIERHLESLQGFKNILSMDNIAGMSDEDLLRNYKDYVKALKTFQNDLVTLGSSGTKLASVTNISSLDNKMQAWMKKNTKAAKEYGGAIEALRDQLKKLGLTDAEFKTIKGAFDQLDLDAAAKGLKGKSFIDQIKSAATSMLGFVSVGEVINTTVRGLKEMYHAVYDIDTAMTNLYKVTDETAARYDKFLKDSASASQELGRTISSYVEQTATWSKLGYSLDESEELAKLSSVYANVAEVDDATAVSDMVTAMKAFNIEAQNAVNVIDPLNELGNTFATDAASLGDGLSKSASAMNAAGTDMYKTLAMLTGVTEITQNAGEAGNFLKVASMRIRGMKGELEELGEEVDSSVDSISKVQTQILNLTHGEVNIFDDAGEFRDYYEIMKEIADVYNQLTSTEQASLTEILFGKMRGNQGQALIQAFQSGQVEKAYQTALNSTGSAAEEQARWMESLEAKTQQFQAAWQNLSQTVLSSDFLKAMVDSGTTLLNILSGIVDTIGVIGTLASGAGITAFLTNLD